MFFKPFIKKILNGARHINFTIMTFFLMLHGKNEKKKMFYCCTSKTNRRLEICIEFILVYIIPLILAITRSG